MQTFHPFLLLVLGLVVEDKRISEVIQIPGEETLIFPSIYNLEYFFEDEIHNVSYQADTRDTMVLKCFIYENEPYPAEVLSVSHLKCGSFFEWFQGNSKKTQINHRLTSLQNLPEL